MRPTIASRADAPSINEATFAKPSTETRGMLDKHEPRTTNFLIVATHTFAYKAVFRLNSASIRATRIPVR